MTHRLLITEIVRVTTTHWTRTNHHHRVWEDDLLSIFIYFSNPALNSLWTTRFLLFLCVEHTQCTLNLNSHLAYELYLVLPILVALQPHFLSLLRIDWRIVVHALIWYPYCFWKFCSSKDRLLMYLFFCIGWHWCALIISTHFDIFGPAHFLFLVLMFNFWYHTIAYFSWLMWLHSKFF